MFGRRKKKMKVLIAKCKSRKDKQKIMESKKKLETERMYIDNDLTCNERRTRQIVIKFTKQLRKQGERETERE